jgi:hypothetical protein
MRRWLANSWVAVVAISVVALWILWTWASGDPVIRTPYGQGSRQCLFGIPCAVVQPELRIGGHLVLPHQLLAGIAIAFPVLLLSRRAIRRLGTGPLRLADVTLSPSQVHSTGDEAAGAKAVIMECLLLRNIQSHGVIPSYSGIDSRATDLQGTPQFPQVGHLLTRVAVALVQSSVVHPGFSVTVTETRARRPYHVGLTFTIQRVSTGAIEHVDTCWAASLDEGARKVGFRLATWHESMQRNGRRNRSGLAPTASSLHHQYAAWVEGRHRRYDGAVHHAREGLRADPGNVALRRQLGETYERLGLGMDAMVVYASGLIELDDERNGWRSAPVSVRNDRHSVARRLVDRVSSRRTVSLNLVERRAWRVRRRLLPFERPKHRDVESAGLLWRYIANLGMSEQWSDVLIAETARVDDFNRPLGSHRGNHPWFSERDSTKWMDVPSSEVDVARGWYHERERSSPVRGFLARRYESTLCQRFPLLSDSFFQERLPRDQPFTTSRNPGRGPGVGDLLDEARRLRPPRRHRPQNPCVAIDGDGQVADLWEVVRKLIQLHRLAWQGPPGEQRKDPVTVSLHRATRECFSAALEYVIENGPLSKADKTGRRASPRGHEVEALEAMLPGGEDRWQKFGLSRSLVVACVTRLMAQLSAVHRHVAENSCSLVCPGASHSSNHVVAQTLDAAMHECSDLFARVAASLDLQLALTRSAMTDLDRLVARRAEALPLGDDRLSRLLWSMAHHRYCVRLLYLERSNGFPGSHQAGNDHAFLERADALVLMTHRRVEAILHERRLRDRDRWDLSYYAACAYAVTIPDFPGTVDGESSAVHGSEGEEPKLPADNTYHQWCNRYDANAKLAIHYLDEAVRRRASSQRNLSSKGVSDWILDEDPDLDLLRRHPRFRRWAAQQFQVTLLPDWRSRAFLRMRANRYEESIKVAGRARRKTKDSKKTQGPSKLSEVPHFRQRCSLGVLGSAVPWKREYIRWGLTHTHYLLQGLFATVPAAAEQLSAMAQRLQPGEMSPTPTSTASGQPEPTRLRLAQTSDQLVRFWASIPLYRSMVSSPELRLEVGELLRPIGGLQHTLLPTFPREADVLMEARFLNFAELDERLKDLAPRGLATSVALQLLVQSGRATTLSRPQAAELLSASASHLDVLLQEVNSSLDSEPSRLSLRQGGSWG